MVPKLIMVHAVLAVAAVVFLIKTDYSSRVPSSEQVIHQHDPYALMKY